MKNRRTIAWSTAMRDLRGERARRAGVREERLRATAGLRQAPLQLSSWRGRSGRRYVVGVHAFDEVEALHVTEAVVLAVRRDEDGTAHVIDVATAGSRPVEQARSRWMTIMREQGATEVHVHRLAEDENERRAIVADLREDETRAS
jgi:hypothetical protein